METFLESPTSLKFLVVHDLDYLSTAKLSERFVPLPPYFDAILVVGPLQPDEREQKEDEAIALGDIASFVAQLENIVCRVIYLPADTDPTQLITNQLHITPNSISIHGRRLNLTPDLYVMGFTEKSDSSSRVESYSQTPDDYDGSNEDMENVEIVSGVSTSLIRSMLSKGKESLPSNVTDIYSVQTAISESQYPVETGIFLLNYRYAHTLNQFLFHMNDEIEQANVELAIIISTATSDIARLPKKFGKLSIVAPKSLKHGYYTTVEMSRGADGKWSTTAIEHHQM